MNIFETIGRVTSRTEPYHSRFLAESLQESLRGDPSLFNSVWRLAAPQREIPTDAEVIPEQPAGAGRIDICIHAHSPKKCVVGIEVKTFPGSAEPGQLEKYRDGLAQLFPQHDIQITYLTPFNERRADVKAHTFSDIQVFKKFAKEHKTAQHVSWLDIAKIPWDGNELWKQHQFYVENQISRPALLEASTDRERELAHFFGDQVTKRFWQRLDELGIAVDESGIIELSRYPQDKCFAKSLAGAFAILLGGEGVSRHSNRRDKFPAELRSRFLESAHGEVHRALFNLADSNSFVWVDGKRDYALRTAHDRHPSGVSLVRSRGVDCLMIGQRR